MTDAPAFSNAAPLLRALTVRRSATSPLRVTMLKVPKSKRPAEWQSTGLSGRFLPLDPKDETVIDVLESKDRDRNEEYGLEGPPDSAYGHKSRKAWNKRAAAAKKRWEDPEYRAKMLAKRASTKERKRAMQVGAMESITLCDDERAKEINDYVRSNRLRSEKLTFYHRDRKAWMESRLSEGAGLRWRRENEEYKKMAQEKRKLEARRRHARMRAKKELEEEKAEN